MDYDSTWCYHCQREIIPKRFLVPVPQQPPAVPNPPPPSPPPNARRTKSSSNNARRQGLVHGTGRVRPNGTLKRVDSSKSNSTAPTKPQETAPAVKHRTVIEQGPLPLYCSDECRLADLNESSSQLLDPSRQSPPLPPVPHNSFSEGSSSDDRSSARSSSVESSSSRSRPHSPYAQHSEDVDPSLATLARYYNFKRPIPSPFPLDDPEPPSPEADLPEYNGGIMMAGRRIQELCRKPEKKKTTYGPVSFAPPEPRKPVKGWDDGTTEWRASIYSFAHPRSDTTSRSAEDASKAAFSHRSKGVLSTMGSGKGYAAEPVTSNSSPSLYCPETAQLYAQFSASLNRRSESRVFRGSQSVHSYPAAKAPARERSLLMPGAEGKLLVPDVKLPVYTGSSSSLSTSRSKKRAESESASKRPAVEFRSWSYDNVRTYPVMQLPPKKEKRIVTELVNGVEVEREIEVEVEQPRKKLFNFPPKEVIVRR